MTALGARRRVVRPQSNSDRGGPTTVLYALGAGAAEHEVVELARQLDPLRFRLVFAAVGEPPPSPGGGTGGVGARGARGAAEAADRLRALGFAVLACPPGPAFAVRFRRLLRDVEPDVVHVMPSSEVSAVIVAARTSRTRRRVVHLSPSPAGPTNLRGAFGRRAAQVLLDAWATDLVGASEVVMRRAWGEEWRLDPRCRLIYPGVAIEPFGVAIAARRRALDIGQDADPNVVTVVHIGEGGPVDNRRRAVDVLVALRGRGVNARLRIAGPCDELEQRSLATQAARRGMAGHVEFVGTRVEPAKLLVAGSMTLLTSVAGAGDLPRPVLESCAVGTPVLSADLPVVREIARLLPGVTMLPLGADDEVWADTARALTVAPPSLSERREALRMFVRSPFTAANWQREMTALWS